MNMTFGQHSPPNGLGWAKTASEPNSSSMDFCKKLVCYRRCEISPNDCDRSRFRWSHLVCFFVVWPSTGADKKQAPTFVTVVQMWLIYLLLLSRGIHYSANRSLANVQYKCHDYVHIDHRWRDSVGKACSPLWSLALHWHWVCRGGNEREVWWGRRKLIVTGDLLMRHAHTHTHSYRLYENISKLVNHTHFSAHEEDVYKRKASEEPQSGSNADTTHNCKHSLMCKPVQ